MPASGHRDGLGPRPEPRDRPQAPLPEADPALAADQDRPRAMHPLLPLRALQPGGGRGRAAPASGAGRVDLRGHVRRPPLHRPLPRQHHRALSGGGADLGRLPVPGPSVGHRGRRLDLHALPEPVQRDPDGARRADRARPRPRPSRGRRRLAVRQGAVRLPDGGVRGPDHAAARPPGRRASSRKLGAGARSGGGGPSLKPASGPPRSSAGSPRTRRDTSRSGSSAGHSARRTWNQGPGRPSTAALRSSWRSPSWRRAFPTSTPPSRSW